MLNTRKNFARTCDTLAIYAVIAPGKSGHEQAFWAGDSHITALINILLYGAYDLDQRSIRLVGQSLSPDWIKAYHPDDEAYLNGLSLTFAAFPHYPDGDLPMWTFLWAIRDEWAYQRYLEFARREGWAVMPWEEYLSCSRVSEQTNTLALLCDCVPVERLEAISAIVRRVEAGRYRFNIPAHRTHAIPSEEEAPDGIVPIGTPFFL